MVIQEVFPQSRNVLHMASRMKKKTAEIIKHGFPHKSPVGETDLLTVNVSVIMKHTKMFCTKGVVLVCFRLQGRLLEKGGSVLNLEEPV